MRSRKKEQSDTSERFELSRVTTGQMSLFAQSNPLDSPPCLRSFWCGRLADAWDLHGPVTKEDFTCMFLAKRPLNRMTKEILDCYNAVEKDVQPNLSSAWSVEMTHPDVVYRNILDDPRLIDVIETRSVKRSPMPSSRGSMRLSQVDTRKQPAWEHFAG